MAVPKYRRTSHEKGNKDDWLDVIISAEDLLYHTKRKLSGKGKTYFSKSDTFTKKIPLLQTAKLIYHNVRKANRINAYDEAHFEKRHDLQLEALLALEDIYADLTEYNDEKKIEHLEYWISIVDTTEKLLTGWIKSDIDRWNKLQTQRIKTQAALQELIAMPFKEVQKVY